MVCACRLFRILFGPHWFDPKTAALRAPHGNGMLMGMVFCETFCERLVMVESSRLVENVQK